MMGGIFRRSSKWNTIATELYAIKKTLSDLSLKEKDLLKELKDLSNYQNSYNKEFLFSQSTRVGSIDYDSIPELKKVNLELYRKPPITCWKLTKI